jgi:transposase-like protein
MRTVTSIWLDKTDDASLIEMLRRCGVRELARQANVSPSLISKWMKAYTGMSSEKYERVIRASRILS